MKRYIEQLIEDIRHAVEHAPPQEFPETDLDDEEALEMELEESERIVNGPFEKLGDIVGLSKGLLPAPERLTEKQKMTLIPELEKLLNAYNFIPDYPENVPFGMLYKAFYTIWDDDFVRITSGQYHIEFCDYDEENCPFPGFCNFCSGDNDHEEIPENEFNVKASDLTGDEKKIDQDFEQMEKEYYMSSEITDDEGFIPGIHNYCDRWCERCDFTDKCRVFAMEEEMMEMLNKNKKEKQGDADDSEHPSDWYAAEQDLLEESDDEPEFEIDFPEDSSEFGHEKDDYFSAHSKAGRHPLAEMAYSYSTKSFNWFRKYNKELQNHFTKHLAKGYADEVMDATEVIQWYHMFIFAKIKRALSGYYELEEFEEADYDMNGSAKVALIGLDRSIEAANILIRHMKGYRETLKTFKDQLEQIRELAEEVFPDARDFTRPGLDEI
jgi:hypothetical protein